MDVAGGWQKADQEQGVVNIRTSSDRKIYYLPLMADKACSTSTFTLHFHSQSKLSRNQGVSLDAKQCVFLKDITSFVLVFYNIGGICCTVCTVQWTPSEPSQPPS